MCNGLFTLRICLVILSLGLIGRLCVHAQDASDIYSDQDQNQEYIPIALGKRTAKYTTQCGQYTYFKVNIDNACDDLNIQVEQIAGEPDLYVSRPSVPFPTYKTLSWSSYQWGSENLTIRSSDPNFSPGKFYIAVHSYCGSDVKTDDTSAEYTVLAQTVPHDYSGSSDTFSTTESGFISAHEYRYHRFCLPNKCTRVNVTLHSCNDHANCPTSYSYPELVVSPNIEKPTVNSYGWLLGESARRSIILNPEDPLVKPGHYYVAVYGWCTPDDSCPDKSTCGPCAYVNHLPYTLSVEATHVECTPDTNTASRTELNLPKSLSLGQLLLMTAAAFVD